MNHFPNLFGGTQHLRFVEVTIGETTVKLFCALDGWRSARKCLIRQAYDALSKHLGRLNAIKPQSTAELSTTLVTDPLHRVKLYHSYYTDEDNRGGGKRSLAVTLPDLCVLFYTIPGDELTAVARREVVDYLLIIITMCDDHHTIMLIITHWVYKCRFTTLISMVDARNHNYDDHHTYIGFINVTRFYYLISMVDT